MIQNIAIDKLYPHPKNPRQDLGDLSELAESIRANGVLQNLTVVPREAGYCTTCALYIHSAGKCADGHDKNNRPPCAEWVSDGGYTVVIGHRRLAAAKLAGLTEIPCAVSNIDQKAQIGTMLLENIQRSDLTPWEQASGIQMMMDLGETVESISEQTGFSESTVRRRVKLLELDPEAFKASVERGATLMDFAELDRIHDTARKNALLESIGTANFKYNVEKAADDEAWEQRRAELLEKLEGCATLLETENPWQDYRFVVRSSRYYGDGELPDDMDEREYFYAVSDTEVAIYIKRAAEESEAKPAEKTPEQLEREARDAWHAELKAVEGRAFDLRQAFAKGYAGLKKHAEAIMEFAAYVIAREQGANEAMFEELSGIPLDTDDEYYLLYDDIGKAAHGNPQRILFLMAYSAIDGGYNSYVSWQNHYEANRDMDMLYELMEALGYQVSDEERKLMDGSHELYEAEEASDAEQDE